MCARYTSVSFGFTKACYNITAGRSLSSRSRFLLVFLHFIVENHKFNATLFEDISGILCCVISSFADNSLYSRANYAHGACSAGLHSAIQGGSFQWYPESSCLNYRILFCVDSSYAVLPYFAIFVCYFCELMTHFITVWHPGWRSSIACA